MKRIFHIPALLVILISFQAKAQTKWSSAFKESDKISWPVFDAFDGKYLYTHKTAQKSKDLDMGWAEETPILDKYDISTMERISSKYLEAPKYGIQGSVYFFHFTALEQQLILITMVSNAEEGNTYFAHQVDNEGKVDPNGKVLAANINKTNSLLEKLNLTTSEDRTLLSAYYLIEDKETFYIRILDKDLTLTDTQPVDDYIFDMTSFTGERRRNLFFDSMANHHVFLRQAKDRPYSLHCYNSSGELYFDSSLNLDEKIYIPTFDLAFDQQGNVYISGIYTYRTDNNLANYGEMSGKEKREVRKEMAKTPNLVKGTFLIVVNTKQKKIVSTSFDPFTKEDMVKFLKDDQIADMEGEEGLIGNEFRTRSLIYKNGKLLLVNEAQNTYVSNPGSSPKQNFENGPLLLTAYDAATGRKEWNYKVSLYQHTRDDGGAFNSIFVTSTDDTYVIFFNDHPSNISNSESDLSPPVMNNSTSNTLMRLDIHPNKEVNKQIPDGSKGKKEIRMDRSKQLGGYVFMLSGKGNVFYLGATKL